MSSTDEGTVSNQRPAMRSRSLGIVVILVIIVASIILCADITKESKINSLTGLAVVLVILLMSLVNFSPSDNIDPFMLVGGEFLKSNPKVDGCCLYPEQPECQKYTREEISRGCCGKGFVGKKVKFASDAESNSPCSCNKKRGK